MFLFDKLFIFAISCLVFTTANAGVDTGFVSMRPFPKGFPLAEDHTVAPLLTATSDYPGVVRAVRDLQEDLYQVVGTKPQLLTAADKDLSIVVIIGTIGKNKWIDNLIKTGRLNVSSISGKWESSVTQVIDAPFPGIKKALVIAGSDKRGTIYGIYTLSAQIGVSPWYWWADVPIIKQPLLYIRPGAHLISEPRVKYRGIFLNDEAPALSGWAKEKFGGFNHQFYEKVFELLLRLKANYLWPAMWGNAFNDDDKLNPQIADKYGIVMGTSHHEPMLRAQQEWKRYGKGEWNYMKNDSALRSFWRQGLLNMGKHESIITVGMRGDGDKPMSENSNINLLEQIVQDQRKIIEDITGQKAEKTPQVWALYKEVQEYFDKGMRVPDDVTLLLCDDNWGNIRRLPDLNAKKREGGYGIYYHFDYVGGPRNYKWLNTNPIQKVREQMNLAAEYGADKIWIVNVGDLKPMEFPIEFFLDYAWAPEKWPANRLQEYTRLWAAKQFGETFATEIADVITKYTFFNGRRKPELLSPEIYSLANFNEAKQVVGAYNDLASKAQRIGEKLAPAYRDAFFQLVLHPVLACANLNEFYYTVAQNRLYAKQARPETDALALKAMDLFKKDAAISQRYNKETAGGKWNHLMDQVHIGYNTWNDPPQNIMPALSSLSAVKPAGQLRLALPGNETVFADKSSAMTLPLLSKHNQEAEIDILGLSDSSREVKIVAAEAWLKGSVDVNQPSSGAKIRITANWSAIPPGMHKVRIDAYNGDQSVGFWVEVTKGLQALENQPLFLPSRSFLSFDAQQFTRMVNDEGSEWEILPGLGRTNSAVTYLPVSRKAALPNKKSAHLEYDIIVQEGAEWYVNLYLSPSLDFTGGKGLRFGLSVDGDVPQVISMSNNDMEKNWERSVRDNVELRVVRQKIPAGTHILKFWRIDPGVVLQKVVIASAPLPQSYLGPPVTN